MGLSKFKMYVSDEIERYKTTDFYMRKLNVVFA